jgi:hypothetical protein
MIVWGGTDNGFNATDTGGAILRANRFADTYAKTDIHTYTYCKSNPHSNAYSYANSHLVYREMCTYAASASDSARSSNSPSLDALAAMELARYVDVAARVKKKKVARDRSFRSTETAATQQLQRLLEKASARWIACSTVRDPPVQQT